MLSLFVLLTPVQISENLGHCKYHSHMSEDVSLSHLNKYFKDKQSEILGQIQVFLYCSHLKGVQQYKCEKKLLPILKSIFFILKSSGAALRD